MVGRGGGLGSGMGVGVARATDGVGAVECVGTSAFAVVVDEGGGFASLTVGVALGDEGIFDAFAAASVPAG